MSPAALVPKPVSEGAENVPEELREPFYTDQYEQEHVKPPVVRLLLSAELYCRAGSLILKSDAAKPLLGHDAVIQALAQKGLYVTDREKLVTERDLHKKPIQMAREVCTACVRTAHARFSLARERGVRTRCECARPPSPGARLLSMGCQEARACLRRRQPCPVTHADLRFKAQMPDVWWAIALLEGESQHGGGGGGAALGEPPSSPPGAAPCLSFQSPSMESADDFSVEDRFNHRSRDLEQKGALAVIRPGALKLP
ncbi:hypothetical protein CB1_000707037 [Camelus ferus]|nr:hypothetical protein CB1_000707037 [Camelus ferus]